MSPQGPAVTHWFTPEAVRARDYRAFTERFAPADTAARELRSQVGTLVAGAQEFSADPMAACGSPETRAFIQALHRDWPHCFYYFHLSGDHLKAYVFCLLSHVVVEHRSDQPVTLTGYRKEELFQLVAGGVLQSEHTCYLAGMSPSDYRNRSRLVLRYFGILPS